MIWLEAKPFTWTADLDKIIRRQTRAPSVRFDPKALDGAASLADLMGPAPSPPFPLPPKSAPSTWALIGKVLALGALFLCFLPRKAIEPPAPCAQLVKLPPQLILPDHSIVKNLLPWRTRKRDAFTQASPADDAQPARRHVLSGPTSPGLDNSRRSKQPRLDRSLGQVTKVSARTTHTPVIANLR
jgi:hypothetical protein